MYETSIVGAGILETVKVMGLLEPLEPGTLKENSPIILLQQHDPTIPLPRPEFLKVHHIISQILDVSGLGDEIEMRLEMAEEAARTNLSPDGSSDVGLLLSRRMLMEPLV